MKATEMKATDSLFRDQFFFFFERSLETRLHGAGAWNNWVYDSGVYWIFPEVFFLFSSLGYQFRYIFRI